MRIEYDADGLKSARDRLSSALEQYRETAESFTNALQYKNMKTDSACADALNLAGQAYEQLLDHMDYAVRMYEEVQEKLLRMGERLG